MKSCITTQIKSRLVRDLAAALLVPTLLSLSSASAAEGPGNDKNPGVLPPQSNAYGQTYGQWSADWWTWFMQHPVTGHPGTDSPDFDVTSGQSGKVWFLACPFGTVERTVTIPTGKSLFIGLLNAEASDIEYGTLTKESQSELAGWLADHINTVSCSVDGVEVKNLGAYRVQSLQFSFIAPDPWVFSPTPGGAGTSVADGYYLMLPPFSKGKHTIHVTGSFHFDAGEIDVDAVDFGLDVTYDINVVPSGHN